MEDSYSSHSQQYSRLPSCTINCTRVRPRVCPKKSLCFFFQKKFVFFFQKKFVCFFHKKVCFFQKKCLCFFSQKSLFFIDGPSGAPYILAVFYFSKFSIFRKIKKMQKHFFDFCIFRFSIFAFCIC